MIDELLNRIEEKQNRVDEVALPPGASELDFLEAIWRDPRQPWQRRKWALETLMPHKYPKLAVVGKVTGNDLADRLLYALRASQKVINGRPMQVIEPPKPVVEIPEPAPDHGKPFASDFKSRFRRL